MVLAAATVVGTAQAPGQRRLPGRGPGPERVLRDPRFVPAAQASFLGDRDQVLGVSGEGVAKAYSIPVLAYHHIVQDQLGQLPMLVTW